MTDSVRIQKKELRKKMLSLRDAIPEEMRKKKSDDICRSILDSLPYKESQTIYTFIPYLSEVDLMPVVYDAWAKGKTIGAPLVSGDGMMQFHRILSEEDLVPGYKGIREPKDACPILQDDKAFVLTPGVAFTKDGFRMGYGKGFYDRFFSTHSGFSMGICFSEQIVDSLPVEETDHQLDVVLFR